MCVVKGCVWCVGELCVWAGVCSGGEGTVCVSVWCVSVWCVCVWGECMCWVCVCVEGGLPCDRAVQLCPGGLV